MSETSTKEGQVSDPGTRRCLECGAGYLTVAPATDRYCVNCTLVVEKTSDKPNNVRDDTWSKALAWKKASGWADDDRRWLEFRDMLAAGKEPAPPHTPLEAAAKAYVEAETALTLARGWCGATFAPCALEEGHTGACLPNHSPECRRCGGGRATWGCTCEPGDRPDSYSLAVRLDAANAEIERLKRQLANRNK